MGVSETRLIYVTCIHRAHRRWDGAKKRKKKVRSPSKKNYQHIETELSECVKVSGSERLNGTLEGEAGNATEKESRKSTVKYGIVFFKYIYIVFSTKRAFSRNIIMLEARNQWKRVRKPEETTCVQTDTKADSIDVFMYL